MSRYRYTIALAVIVAVCVGAIGYRTAQGCEWHGWGRYGDWRCS